MVSWELHHCACPQGVLAMIICPLTSSFPQHSHVPWHPWHVPLIKVVHTHGWLKVKRMKASKQQDWEACFGQYLRVCLLCVLRKSRGPQVNITAPQATRISSEKENIQYYVGFPSSPAFSFQCGRMGQGCVKIGIVLQFEGSLRHCAKNSIQRIVISSVHFQVNINLKVKKIS